MNIPKQLKIGGYVYDVEITDKMDLGISNVSAEIVYTDLKIRIAPNNPRKMEADFIHEMIHGVLAFLGYKEHDEKQVEEMAQALYMIIQDNPGLFDANAV